MRKWLNYYGLSPLAGIPPAMAYRVAGGIGLINRYTQRRRDAQFIAAQMAKVFPDLPPKRRGAAVREYFQLMARERLDVFTLARTRLGETVQLSAESLEVLRDAKVGGRGVILVMGHFGRINLLLLALALAGERLGMLTMAIDETNPDLDLMDRGFFRRKVYGLRDRIGGPLITLNDDKRVIYRALAAGETLVMLMDAITEDYHRQKKAAYGLGCGQLHLPTGIARIAQGTGAALVYGEVPEGGWRAAVRLRRLVDEPTVALAQAAAWLTTAIQERPGQWWQWGQLDLAWRS